MKRLLVAVVFVCLVAGQATAQQSNAERPIQAAAIQYSWIKSSDETLQGYQTELSWNRFSEKSATQNATLPALFGLDASFSQHFGTGVRQLDLESPGPDRVRVRRTTMLVGAHVYPLLPWYPGYIRGVVGYSRRLENWIDDTGLSTHHVSNSPAFGVGTGIVFPIHKHVVVRPIQVDYLHFVGEGNGRDALKFATGISILW